MIMAWAELGEEMAAGQIDETVQVLAGLRAAGVRCYTLSNMEPRLRDAGRGDKAMNGAYVPGN
jgi:hypothetical protein